MTYRARRLLLLSLLVIVVSCGIGPAQPRRTDRIGALINGLNEKSEYDAEQASRELIKMGRVVLPRLISSLKTRKGCNFKINAARTVLKLDPQQPIGKSALFEVATYKCQHSLSGTLADSQAYILNTYAAMILGEEVEDGIPLLVKMFSDKSPLVRENAARGLFAFVRSVEKAAKESRGVSETRMAAFRTALPELVKALSDEDELVRCSTFTVLSHLNKTAPKELQVEAARALEGKESHCPK